MEWDSDLAKYPRYWHNRLKRGFGLGVGLDYQPWLRVRDVPSRGSSGNPKGIIIPRVYHLLSTPERIYFHLLDRQPDVVDIREQFPILHLHATQVLCGELEVTHPRRGRYPEPFTIDFLVTRKTTSGFIHEARSIKTPEDAADESVRARLNIEYQWCRQNNIDWKLVDTRGFTSDLLSTLTFMRGWVQHRYKPEAVGSDKFTKVFNAAYRTNRPLNELVEACARRLKRSYSQSLNDFRYCVWSGRIPIELASKLTLHLPVVLNGTEYN